MSQKMTSSKEKICTIYCVLLGIFPILNLYSVGKTSVISIGEILILLFSVCFIPYIFSFKKSELPFFYILFLIYAFFITIINIVLINEIETFETIKRIIRDFFYIFIFLFVSKTFFNFQKTLKILNVIGVILSIFIVAQFFAYLLFKIYLPGIIPPLYSNYENVKNTMLTTAGYEGYLRPNGFFKEPAHAAQYLSVILLLNLIGVKKKKWLTIAIIAIGMIFTTSVNAFVFIGFIFFVYILYLLIYKKGSKRFFGAVLVITIPIVFLILYNNFAFVKWALDRVFTMSSNSNQSTNSRVFRGLYFYFAMPDSGKIFGIGFGNFIGYKQHFQINTAFEMEAEYMNMNIYVIISTGIIGTLLVLFALIKAFKKGDYIQKCCLALLLLMGLSSSVYSSPIYVLLLSFALYDSQKLFLEGSEVTNIIYGRKNACSLYN